MAKSLRSKWRRKMKAEKRIRYGKKEDARLLAMLEQTKKDKEEKVKEDAKNTMEHEPQVLGAGGKKKLISKQTFLKVVMSYLNIIFIFFKTKQDH